MKKRLVLASLAVAISSFVVAPLAAHAATEPLDIPKATTEPIPQSSGYVDKNGNPISVDEYNKQREESTKGAFEKYPVPFAIVGVAVVGGVAFLVYKKTSKK
jgi:hypothetical protein